MVSEHTTEETLMYLRQCLLPGNVQDGIDLEIPSWLVREAVAELEKALGVISMLEHHWISPMEYYEAIEDFRKRVEAWRHLVDSYVNGDGTAGDLECALENGPMTQGELAEMVRDYEIAQQEEA